MEMIGYLNTKVEVAMGATTGADYQTLLDRLTRVADDIVQTVGKLGVLVREELELRAQLRRAAEAAGSRTNPFATATPTESAVNSELTRAGLNLRRADPRIRLAELTDSQHVRYRNQMSVREQVRGQSAA
jgi:hypothetical protein